MGRHVILIALSLTLSLTVVLDGSPARAETPACKLSEFGELIDNTGAYLRSFARDRRPQLHAKFGQLAKKKGWPDSQALERGYQFVQDAQTNEMDQRGRKLLIELDKLSNGVGDTPDCRALERLQSVTLELRAVTEAKFNRMSARVDRALAPKKPAGQTVTTKQSATPKKQAQKPKLPEWQTQTKQSEKPPQVTALALPPLQQMPAQTTFTTAEISEAGRGFFGSISAELASIIQYAFEAYGEPTGYILGTEGGGAFLAGISYGQGRLHMKQNSDQKVFWQGPTVGYDLGLQGSRVMFLVYNLEQPEQIFKRFGGIGGSAYVVGGVGITYHKRGRIVLAPIRTGLGLRLGANIGYLKFTPQLTINPF